MKLKNMEQIPVVLGLIKDSKNRILVQKRIDPSIPESNGKWEFVGGKIEWNETPEQAVVREVLEETGLQVVVSAILPKLFVDYWTRKDGSEFKVILLPYICEVVGGTLFKNIPDPKISEYKYIRDNEIETLDWLTVDKDIAQLFNTV